MASKPETFLRSSIIDPLSSTFFSLSSLVEFQSHHPRRIPRANRVKLFLV